MCICLGNNVLSVRKILFIFGELGKLVSVIWIWGLCLNFRGFWLVVSKGVRIWRGICKIFKSLEKMFVEFGDLDY